MLLLALTGCGPDGIAFLNPRAALVLTPAELTFPATAPGEWSRVEVRVENTGTASAVVSLSAPSPFLVDGTALVLGTGGSATRGVYFHPSDWADVLATLTLGSPGLSSQELPIRGVVLRDADADGFDTIAAGGDDCDDTTAAIQPGAPDTCGDGLDQDCDPANDVDCDGDGVEAPLDCADDDSAVYPGATETGPDGRDEDCDGLIDESAVSAGDLVLTELSPQDPAWIEVCNTTSRAIGLLGYFLATNAGTFPIEAGAREAAVVEPAACAAICASDRDTCAYTAPIHLDAEADTVVLGVEGTLLDVVVIDDGWQWEVGRVWSADPASATAAANDASSAWCLTEGSAGSPNPACP